MFIDFLIENWRLLLEALFALVALVLFIVRKKPVTSIYSAIYAYAIQGVNAAEKTSYKGDSKLAFALKITMDLLTTNYPALNVDGYKDIIVQIIEQILTTPQKK